MNQKNEIYHFQSLENNVELENIMLCIILCMCMSGLTEVGVRNRLLSKKKFKLKIKFNLPLFRLSYAL